MAGTTSSPIRRRLRIASSWVIGDLDPFLLLDPTTLEVVTNLPVDDTAIQHGSAFDITSSDYRYAARGTVGGHGGLCGGSTSSRCSRG